MAKLDPHTLFSIFEKGDEEIYEEHGELDVLKNPFVLMGMVLRGLENYDLMSILYSRNYPEDFKRVEKELKYRYYNKLYSYLQRINVKSMQDMYTIGDSYENTNVIKAMDTMIEFYDGYEEYEKCAILVDYKDLILSKQIQDLIKNSH